MKCGICGAITYQDGKRAIFDRYDLERHRQQSHRDVVLATKKKRQDSLETKRKLGETIRKACRQAAIQATGSVLARSRWDRDSDQTIRLVNTIGTSENEFGPELRHPEPNAFAQYEALVREANIKLQEAWNLGTSVISADYERVEKAITSAEEEVRAAVQ